MPIVESETRLFKIKAQALISEEMQTTLGILRLFLLALRKAVIRTKLGKLKRV